MDMTVRKIEQLVLRCIAINGLTDHARGIFPVLETCSRTRTSSPWEVSGWKELTVRSLTGWQEG